MPGASQYVIDVATDNNFINTVKSQPYSSSPVSITGLNPNTDYFLRIRATDGSCYSNYTNYSSIIHTLTQQSNTPPVAAFTTENNLHFIDAGQNIQFHDQSSNNPTQIIWTFAGGSPSSSNYQNPIVTYNTPGTYRVTLHVCNLNGCDDAVQIGYINVKQSATNQLPPPVTYSVGDNNHQYPIAEPILTGTGTYKYRHTDFEIPFVDMPITFSRTYSSSNHLINSALGYG